MDKYDIIASEWRSGLTYTIGIVAYKTAQHDPSLGQWCAAMSLAIYANREVDEKFIAGDGAKLSSEEAHAFFPHLDITKYKYYRGNE